MQDDLNKNHENIDERVTDADRENIQMILANVSNEKANSQDAELTTLLSQFTHNKITSGVELFEIDLSDDEKTTNPSEYVKKEEVLCKNCWNKGFTIIRGKTVICTECLTYKKVHGSKVEQSKSRIAELNIPEYYQTHTFDTRKLQQDKTLDEQRHDNYDIYRANLRMLYENFEKGALPKASYFIAAPLGYGKNHFVYSSMLRLLECGLTIPPYLDTEELLELRLTNPNAFQQHIKAPMLFIKILVAYTEVEDVEMMRYITEKRGRMNLPTIIVSRYNYNYLSYLEPHLSNLFTDKEVTGLYTRLTKIEAPFLADYAKYKEERIERNNNRKRYIENPRHTEEEHKKYIQESPPIENRKYQ